MGLLLLTLLWPLAKAQIRSEAIYCVHNMKSLYTVSEHFVSLSIDPAIILTGLNLSDATLQMAQCLSPAYVRIAGPSTQFVKFAEENAASDGNYITVTPSMWFGITQWFSMTNLTPVFGLNDGQRGAQGWNPESTMEILDAADKFNVSCYWQLGYDCSNKTAREYASDLKRLQHVLDAFPERKHQWKIITSDFTNCVKDGRKGLESLETVVTAVVIEQPHHQPKDASKIPKWTTSSKPLHHISFSTAISWAKELGDAAKAGFEVILKQPRLHEIYSVTSTFWVSIFHKRLMGRNVLDVKPTIGHPDLWVYAHCSKNQNDFVRSGAMTLFVINNSTNNQTILLKFGSISLRNAEVQSYVLTSNEGEVLLNGEKLSLDQMDFAPKIRRARIMNYLSLPLLAKSVSFFVVPGAQLPVCASEEADLQHLMAEICEDQKIDFSEEVLINPRFLHKRPILSDLKNVMERELESDERHCEQLENPKIFQVQRDSLPQKINKKQSGDLIDKPPKEESIKVFELELTSAELRKVLSDRAKAKAAKKNIIFTSEELEEIMNKATQKFLNGKNTFIRISKKSKREIARDKKDINMKLLKLKTLLNGRILKESLKTRPNKHKRQRRDINMDLLKLKSDTSKKYRNKFQNKQTRIAVLRGADQTSDEFLESEEQESPLPDKDVFAELAENDFFLTTAKPKIGLKVKLPKIEMPRLKTKMGGEEIKVKDFEPSLNSDDYDCIHEFSGKANKEETRKSAELWELTKVEENENDELPSLRVRLNEKEEKSELEDELEDEYGDFDIYDSSTLRLKRSLEKTKRKEVIKEDNNSRITRKSFNERYKSLSEGLKKWNSFDIVKLRQSKKQVKRSVYDGVDSAENEIHSFLNEIEKEKIWSVQDEGVTRATYVNKPKMKVKSPQKIDKVELESVWNEFIQKLSKFVKGLTDKLTECVFKDLLGWNFHRE